MNLYEKKNPKQLKFQLTGNSRYEERYLYISQTHDPVLLSWLMEKIQLGKSNDFFLLTIDKHIDLPFEQDWDEFFEELDFIKRIGEPQYQLEEVKKSFSRICKGEDIHFLLAALELNLINGCVIISPDKKKKKRLKKLRSHYSDHKIFHIPSIEILVNPRLDRASADQQELSIERLPDIIKGSDLLIDIDLDYFTYKEKRKRYVLSEERLNRIFSNKNLKHLFKNRASCITIALEEGYCNDHRDGNNCAYIFNRITKYFREMGLIGQKLIYKKIKKQLR